MENKVNILSNISDTLTCYTITVLIICNSKRMYIFLRIIQTYSTSLVNQITKLGYNTLSILQPTIIIIKDLIFSWIYLCNSHSSKLEDIHVHIFSPVQEFDVFSASYNTHFLLYIRLKCMFLREIMRSIPVIFTQELFKLRD